MKMLFILLASPVLAFAQDSPTVTQSELVERTQTLYDALAPGDKSPWQHYLADDAMVHDEKGGSYNKETFLATVQPLPPGYSGSIKVTHPQAIFVSGVAILSYDTEENEIVFHNRMTARYHQTDTWLYRRNLWQIASSQAMRYYEDPAPATMQPAALGDYAGTYELALGSRMIVTSHDGKLFAQRGAGNPVQLLPESPDMFFRAGIEGRRLFHRNAEGKVDWLIDRRNNEDMIWRKIE